MNDNLNVFEIDENEFEEKVVKASSSYLILLDFWAPWCGPCKQLTPLLEKITNKAGGKIKLIKINIDNNQQIAAQLRIQSIPAVFAFKDGQPVDGFQGVISEKEIIKFVEKSMGEKLEEDHNPFYNTVNELIIKNEFEIAKNELENFLANYPNEYKGYAIYIDCLCHLKKYNDAEEFIISLTEDAKLDKEINGSIQKLIIKKKNSEGPSLNDLINKFTNGNKKIEDVLILADKYFSEDMLDEAFELLLSNYKNFKVKTKAKLLEYFEALGNNHEKTIFYRKKLSSIIFS